MLDFTPNESTRLADYLAGELSNSDATEVERWINEHPDRRTFVDAMSDSRLKLDSAAGQVSPEIHSQFLQMSQNLRQMGLYDQESATGQRDVKGGDKYTNRVPWFSRISLPSVGVAVLASVLLVIAGLQYNGSSRVVGNSDDLSTYTTKNGERATVTLPDGSSVMLNVGSKVQIPTNYSSGNRMVYLVGEAYFTVNHHEGSPFTVVSGPSITKVLGTKFAVRHYSSDTAAHITVEDGKVSVGSKILTAGQQVSVSHELLGAVEPANYARLGFASNRLMIDGMPLASAIVELNRWYDADIQIGDQSLIGRRVFGVFQSGSLTDLEMMLEWAFDLRVERIGRILTLYPKS